MLKRGTLVILNDCDAPEARMVAVLTSYNSREGYWHARYLSTFPNMTRCTTTQPTPVADFGVLVEFRGDEFRCVQVRASVARYRDGVPRRWQDYRGSRWLKMRSAAADKVARAA